MEHHNLINRRTKLALLFWTLMGFELITLSQTTVMPASSGFDILKTTIPHRSIDTIVDESQTVGTTRKALVYKIPIYSKNIKYPVLYLLHSIGGNEKEWFQGENSQIILDNLFAAIKNQPIIEARPIGKAMKDDRAIGNHFDEEKVEAFSVFEYDLFKDFIPFIKKHYPVLKDAEHRALVGLSMGSGQYLNFGLGHLETFAWIGGFSSAPYTKLPKDLLPNPEEAKKELKLLWISCGDRDQLVNISQRIHEYLFQNK